MTTGDLITNEDLPAGIPRARCTANNKSGTRCKYNAVPGATVCRMHGGNAPQVRRKAAMRLQELILPAIGVLAKEMVNGEHSADRIRAANSALDRAGVERRTEMSIEDARAVLFAEALKIKARREAGGDGEPVRSWPSDDDEGEEA